MPQISLRPSRRHALIALGLALALFSVAIVSTADARTYRMTLKRMKQIGTKAANEKEADFEAEDGTVIIDWTGSCRVISRTRGSCDIDYEFDDGAICSDVVRATLNKRTNRATYWSDSDGEDDGGVDDEFTDCTDPDSTDDGEEEDF